jgi:hypothetical protein
MTIGKYPYPSPIDQYRAALDARRAPDRPVETVQIALTDAGSRRVGESVREASPAYLPGLGSQPASSAVGPRTNAAAATRDVAGSLEQANRQIARAFTAADAATADLRVAQEAYRVAGQGRDESLRQAQLEGAGALDITV